MGHSRGKAKHNGATKAAQDSGFMIHTDDDDKDKHEPDASKPADDDDKDKRAPDKSKPADDDDTDKHEPDKSKPADDDDRDQHEPDKSKPAVCALALPDNRSL